MRMPIDARSLFTPRIASTTAFASTILIWQVATILDSLPKLADVAALSAFILIMFGVLGVQLFKGLLLYRCYEGEGTQLPIDAEYGVCSDNGQLNSQGTCGVGESCRFYGVNPVSGTISFDTITWAW